MQIAVQNRKARYNYSFIELFEAGIQLQGSEIKSLRNGRVEIAWPRDQAPRLFGLQRKTRHGLDAARFELNGPQPKEKRRRGRKSSDDVTRSRPESHADNRNTRTKQNKYTQYP